VGKIKHVRAMAGAIEGDTFVGSKAQELRGLLSLNYPMEHGVIQNWGDMERIWNYIFTEELKSLPEQVSKYLMKHSVLVTEAPLNPRKNRDQMAEVFFETFNIPAIYVSIQAVLSLYASGRTTGVVLDVGDGVSHAVPVYQGFVVPQAIKRMDLAGRYLSSYPGT
jgi:centractin